MATLISDKTELKIKIVIKEHPIMIKVSIDQ